MRRLAIVIAALALASPATAAPPQVHASAWLVQDARTGEVLACLRVYAEIDGQAFPGRVIYRDY